MGDRRRLRQLATWAAAGAGALLLGCGGSGAAPSSLVAAPSGLAATATSSTAVRLTWVDNSADETAFELERSGVSDSAGFTRVATPGPNLQAWDDATLQPLTPYWYRLRARGPGGLSDWSAAAAVTTQQQVVLPKYQYTVRDIPPDGVPDVFVGADPFLDMKPTTEDRALLQFDITGIAAGSSNVDLDLTIGTLDPGGTAGTITVYWWEASGFTDLSDFVTTGKTLVTSFTGPNGNSAAPFVLNLTTQVLGLRASFRSYLGLLFVATGSDRFRITNTVDAATDAEKPHLAVTP